MVLLSNEFLCLLLNPCQLMQLGCATAVIPGADDVSYNTGYYGIVVQAEDFAVDFQFI